MSETLSEIRRLLEPILDFYGLFLWDLEFRQQGPQWLLRVYIDKESGVTLNDCEAVSRDLGAALDVEDFIQHAYTLEVSSPGLDRVLSRPEHFKRFVGSRIKVKTYQPIDGRKVFLGELAGLEGDVVKLKLDQDAIVDIPLHDISKASLEVDF